MIHLFKIKKGSKFTFHWCSSTISFCCNMTFNGIFFFIFTLAAFKPFYFGSQQSCTNNCVVELKRGVSNRNKRWKGKYLQPLLAQNFLHEIKTSVSASLMFLFHKFIWASDHPNWQVSAKYCPNHTISWTILLSERNLKDVFTWKSNISQPNRQNWNTVMC